MRDIIPKEDSMMNGPMMSEDTPTTKATKKIYPTLRLKHEFFPEAKKMEVGKEYEVELKLKMTGISISRFENDSEFEIIGFGSEDVKEDKKK